MSRAEERIHHDISVPAFKAILANFKEVRYVIDHDGKLHAGAAKHYIHSDIWDDNTGPNIICGYVRCEDGKYTHHPFYGQKADGRDRIRFVHPLFKKFEEKKITRTKERYNFIF